MTRMRTVKAEICSSEQFVSCSRDARLMFILLWTHCDDAGVHTDSARRLKMELFPADDDASTEAIGMWLAELVQHRLVAKFESGGTEYLYVTGWQRHQRVRNPYYRFPKPPNWEGEHSISTDTAQHQCGNNAAPVPYVYENDIRRNETDTKKDETKRASTSDVSADALSISWSKVTLDSRKIISEVGPVQTKGDHSLVFKAAALAQVVSEDFLWDSVEAVKAAYGRASPPEKSRYAYFHGVLRSKAKTAGKNLAQLLKRIPEPTASKDAR